MDDTVKAFIERQNVAHYIDQLKAEAHAVKRDTLLKLLAEGKSQADQSRNGSRPARALSRSARLI